MVEILIVSLKLVDIDLLLFIFWIQFIGDTFDLMIFIGVIQIILIMHRYRLPSVSEKMENYIFLNILGHGCHKKKK